RTAYDKVHAGHIIFLSAFSLHLEIKIRQLTISVRHPGTFESLKSLYFLFLNSFLQHVVFNSRFHNVWSVWQLEESRGLVPFLVFHPSGYGGWLCNREFST